MTDVPKQDKVAMAYGRLGGPQWIVTKHKAAFRIDHIAHLLLHKEGSEIRGMVASITEANTEDNMTPYDVLDFEYEIWKKV